MAEELFPRSLKDDDWQLLIERIKEGECVPFLGRRVSPVSTEPLAKQWAQKCRIPNAENIDFARLALYMAMGTFARRPKENLCKHISSWTKPDFKDPLEPHAYLASLDIKLFMTTNYDDYMYQAINERAAKDKVPMRGIATWNDAVRELAHDFDGAKIDIATPLVYHVNGHISLPESVVLTEDDYLDFLSSLHHDTQTDPTLRVIDLHVREILSRSSWLLLGYKLEDWDLRLLLRFLDSIRKVNQNMHVSVQLYPFDNKDTDACRNALAYLDTYFNKRDVRVFWGSVADFIKQLHNKL